jgi:hypothetical protein
MERAEKGINRGPKNMTVGEKMGRFAPNRYYLSLKRYYLSCTKQRRKHAKSVR